MCRASTKRNGWRIASAGFFPSEGEPVSSESLATLERHRFGKLDLRSRALTQKLVRRASYIFVMETKHADSMRKKYPQAASKTYMISSFCRSKIYRDRDVPDPVGGEAEDFEETYRVLSDAIPRLIDFVRRQGNR